MGEACISITNDSEILADFIYAVRDAKDVEELNAYIEKRILSYSCISMCGAVSSGRPMTYPVMAKKFWSFCPESASLSA
jgi:hypothetical protein